MILIPLNGFEEEQIAQKRRKRRFEWKKIQPSVNFSQSRLTRKSKTLFEINTSKSKISSFNRGNYRKIVKIF